jgi:hypothetical protein
MSLSARERHALKSIMDDIARSDPQLALLLTAYTPPPSAQEIPAREQIQRRPWLQALASRRRLQCRSHDDQPARSELSGACRKYAAPLIWLLATAVMLLVAMLLTHSITI